MKIEHTTRIKYWSIQMINVLLLYIFTMLYTIRKKKNDCTQGNEVYNWYSLSLDQNKVQLNKKNKQK